MAESRTGEASLHAAVDAAVVEVRLRNAQAVAVLRVALRLLMSALYLLALGGSSPAPLPALLAVNVAHLAVGVLVLVLLRLLASFLACVGFAFIFNSTVRMALAAALIGMVANTIRLEVVDLGVAMQAGTMLAALVVGLLAAVVAPRLRIPRITVSVPAVVIMVPGAAVYRAVVGLNNGDLQVAVNSGVQAVFVVVCIAIGLAGDFELDELGAEVQRHDRLEPGVERLLGLELDLYRREHLPPELSRCLWQHRLDGHCAILAVKRSGDSPQGSRRREPGSTVAAGRVDVEARWPDGRSRVLRGAFGYFAGTKSTSTM